MGAVHLCFKGGFNCKVTVIKVNIKKEKNYYCIYHWKYSITPIYKKSIGLKAI